MTDSLRADYVSRIGPPDGPMSFDPSLQTVSVYGESGPVSVGAAWPIGWTVYRGALATLFRMEIRGTEVPGLWVCDERRFRDLAGVSRRPIQTPS